MLPMQKFPGGHARAGLAGARRESWMNRRQGAWERAWEPAWKRS
jgi:hypothetical protein